MWWWQRTEALALLNTFSYAGSTSLDRSVLDALLLDGDGEMMAVRGQQHEQIENPSPRLEGWCPDDEVSGWKDHLGATISEGCVCVRCIAGANARCKLL